MENGPFEILDTPGQEEVVLTRSFGDEKIRVSFSIADLNAYDPDADEFQDRAMSDEDPNIDPADPSELDPENPSDLLTWGAIVDDVHYSTYTARPGMTTISKLPNGKYIMTYEYGGGPTVNNTSTYLFPVYYRISSSPLTFLSAPATPLITNNGIQPTGSPYNVWTPIGGPNGTIIVSSGGRSEVFVNRALGAADAWKTVATPEGTSYTRHLRVLDSNKNHLLIAGGGILPPSTTNKVTVSVIDITKGLAAES